ncbi:MAG: hypothetical protein CSA29_01775 [Desulfobacterales bacterium]|nr:MAG: hypothetical protein CSA29_01775 [Desulfobacterales bacterium]
MSNSANRALLLLFFLVSFSTQAAAYNSVVAFGDSLTDNGNLGRFTNNALWVETLAASLSLDLYDFAYSGATTDDFNIAPGYPDKGLQWQLNHYYTTLMSHSVSLNDALFTVWAGANDLEINRFYETAAHNIGTALESLYNDGARNFLVLNLPDIGVTPRFIDQMTIPPLPAPQMTSSQATQWTIGFNDALANVVTTFETPHTDINLYRLNVRKAFNDFSAGTPEWAELFWIDGFHPSSKGHQLIAHTALTQLGLVPAPTSIVLIASSMIVIARFRRKQA